MGREGRLHVGRHAIAVVGLTAALGLPLPPTAAAGNADRAEYSYSLTSQAPGTGTGLSLHILHRDPANPDGKPPAVTRNVVDLPAGGHFDDGAVPRCEASDAELQARGRDACPPSSVVGKGRLVVMTGFGPSIDPYSTAVTLFNAHQSVIELVQQQGTNDTLAIDRAQVSGGTYIAAPPPTPGGPPNGKTVIRSVDFTFPPPADPSERSFITTPPTCPARAAWTSFGTFTYDDAAVITKSSDSACQRRTAPRPLRIVIQRMPRRCTSHSFSVRVRVIGGGSLRSTRAALDGRRLRLRSARHFILRIAAKKLKPGRHRLSLTASDALRNRTRRTVRFARCGARRPGRR